MGTLQPICGKCGSTRVGGKCDCTDADIITLVECAYCGHHMPPDAYRSHLQGCAYKASAKLAYHPTGDDR